MRYLKILGLAAVAAAAMLSIAGAGTASATVLCSTTVEPCPPGQQWLNVTFDWSIPAGGSVLQTDTTGEPINTCKESTAKWTMIKNGGANETVTGQDELTSFGGCTFTTTTLKLANTEIHKIAGTSNGTVTADGVTEITINTVFFGSCVYGVKNGASIGDITEGNPAMYHVNAVTWRLAGSNFACPETDRWTATYTLTSPVNTTLSVGNS
jgi:hypothetical protein